MPIKRAREPIGDSPSDLLRRMLNISGASGAGGGLNLPENLDPSPGDAPNLGRAQAPWGQPHAAEHMPNGPPGRPAPDQTARDTRSGGHGHAPAAQPQPPDAHAWRSPASGIGASSGGGGGSGGPGADPSHTSTQTAAGWPAPARASAGTTSGVHDDGPSSRVRGGAGAGAAAAGGGAAAEAAATAPDQARGLAEPTPARKAARAVTVPVGAQGRSSSLGSTEARSKCAADQVRVWEAVRVWTPLNRLRAAELCCF